MKYFFFDLDGSLMYNPNLKDNEIYIPQENVKALQKIVDHDIAEFGIASGRIASVSQQLLDNDNFKAWIIGENGGTLVDLDGNYLLKNRVHPNTYKQFLKFAFDNDFHFEAYNDKKIYLNQSQNNYSTYLEEIARKMNGILEIVYIDDISQIEADLETLNHFSFVPYVDASNVNTIKEFLNTYQDEIDYFHSSVDIIDITPKNIDKIQALKQFLDLHNLDQKDVYYLGDGFNDHKALKYFDNAIVMEHAHEELKKEAKHVVSSAKEAIEIFISEIS